MASISTVLFLNWLPTLALVRTLRSQVELVIEGTINLAGFSVLAQQPSQYSLSADPQNLGGHASLSGSLSLAETGVTTATLGFCMAASSGPRMDDGFALHHETVLDEFSHGDAYAYFWDVRLLA